MSVKFILELKHRNQRNIQDMPAPQVAEEQQPSKAAKGAHSDMLQAKLWGNPCPFSFRINYLALLYNTPLYDWVQSTYGLKRPEYVVLYSLALVDVGSARDISRTSGFPKNTLSRAIKRLELMGLIEARSKAPGGGRKQDLRLSEKGWAMINETRPVFEVQENRMLEVLSDGERQMLSELMSKVVIAAQDWSGELPPRSMLDAAAEKEGMPQ